MIRKCCTGSDTKQHLRRKKSEILFFLKNFEQCFNCCSNICFLLEKCAREAASPGASWRANRHSFAFGGALFFEAFFEGPFFTQVSHFDPKMTSKWTQFAFFREPFLRKMRKLKSVFGLHRRGRIAYEPIPWNAQCDPKLKKKTNT